MITIDWASLTKRKVAMLDDHHGIYFVCGRQGTGKTYMAVNFAKDLNLKNVTVVTNIKSLKIPHENFEKIEDIVRDNREYTCYIIDEIARKYDRNSKTDTQFIAWLNQSRKRKRVVILITQVWKQVPMWLRDPTKFAITTRPVPIVGRWLGLYLTTWGDGENMILDEDKEWVCPPVKVVLHKRNKHVAALYDTFEPIKHL